MREIKIGNRHIGRNYPCFVIAEAGVNHNRSLKIAKKLIDVAKDCGADAVKFQAFRTQDLVNKNTPLANYQRRNLGVNIDQFDMLKMLELKESDFVELKKYCDKKEIIFFSTAHTIESVDLLKGLVPAYKIGSADITNIPLLKKIARMGKPIILSTGMAILKEIKLALKLMRSEGNKEIILLHCTSNYPCRLNEVNLKAMLKLGKTLRCIYGYSDHTEGKEVALLAVALGASVIEKHFTIDRDLEGPDHKASLEPQQLKDFISSIRQVRVILGSGIKKPCLSEQRIKKIVRKSIVTRVDIPRGSRITLDMLAMKRPGTGLSPIQIDKVVNRYAKIDIKKDAFISMQDLK